MARPRPLPGAGEGAGPGLATPLGSLALGPAHEHAVHDEVDEVRERHKEREQEDDVEDQPRDRDVGRRHLDEDRDQRREEGRPLQHPLKRRLLSGPAPAVERGLDLLRRRLAVPRTLGSARALERDLLAFLGLEHVLVLVPLQLLPPATLLPARHGYATSIRTAMSTRR